ncbi:uncharacterized protein LOC129258574 [Lytechinus pictus]|uniref:uncharacterized protein LOC129258574 n=1 Tax=Lytechinus pictus TaxID=7653 RepID=UPI0030B9D14F
MASGFSASSDDSRCEGCFTEDTAHVSYRVEVRQKLCNGCAIDKESSINAAEWFCQKHVMDKAKIFCLTHDAPICEACAITTHSKSTCTLGDVDDTLKERKEDLARLIEMSKENEETFNNQVKSVEEEVEGLEQHFAMEEEKLRLAYEREEKKLKDAFGDRQRKLKDVSARLRDMTGYIKDQPDKKCKDLIEMRTRAEELLKNKSDLMKDFRDVSSFLTCLTAQANTKIDMKVVMKKVTGVAQKVSFAKSDNQQIGTIDVPVETWVQNDEYNPEIGKISYMMGAIAGTEIVIKDTEKHAIYVVNIETKIKKKVIKGNSPYDLWRCVPLRDTARRIVCGSNEGEVVICDHSLKPLIVITVDEEEKKSVGGEKSSVCVAVNKDGLILANAVGSGTIGIYSPEDGRAVGSIDIGTPIYDICALSSGHIVVLNECVEGIDISVLDDSGKMLASKHCHGEGIKSLVVDRGHDLIYLLSWDRRHSDYKVSVLSTSAEFVAERVAVCEPSFYSPSCAIPRPDRMVIYTDGKVLSFRKTNRGLHQLLAEIKLK